MKPLLFIALTAFLLTSCSKDSAENTAENGKSGSITRFAVYQNFMYVLNQNEVQTYDITQKNQPVLVHRLPTDYGLETITIYDNTIFLGSTTALYILNISTPAAPSILSKTERLFEISRGCDPVVVKDHYAFSTIKIIQNVCGNVSSQSALVVYDISNLSAPQVLNTYPLNMPNGLGYKDNYLFICDEGSDNLRVFDISNPEALEERTDLEVSLSDPYDLIIDGHRMIVSCKTDFQIFDIANIVDIKKLGQISK